MAGTNVTYNGVEMRNVETVSWEQTTHMDDSNTDEVYTTHRLRIRGIIHPGYVGNLGFSTGISNTAAQGFVEVGKRLSQPRGDLTVTWGPDDVITVVGTDLKSNQRDVNNGPKPHTYSIQYVSGYRTIGVEWEVEFSIPMCSGNSVGDPQAVAAVLGQPEVLSNRWSATETKDENFYSTVEYVGILIVRRITLNADLFRGVVVPPLLPGFERKQIAFNSTPDGLSLHYRVTDVEKYAAPPAPATDWDCKYTVETSNGATIFSTVNVTLMGPNDTDQRQLLVAAIQVCEARLGNLRQQGIPADPNALKPPRNVWVVGAMVVEDVKNNRITVTMRVKEVATTQDKTLTTIMRLPVDVIGDELSQGDYPIPGYNVNAWPIPDLYNSTVGAFAFQLANPCRNQIPSLASTQTVPSPGGGTTIPPPPNPSPVPGSQGTGNGGTQVTSTVSTSAVTDYKANISIEQQTHQYTFVEIDNRYEVDTGIYQYPIAGEVSEGKPTAFFATLHSPLCRRVFRMRAERTYDWPQLPSVERTRTDINGIKENLLTKQIVPVAPQLLPDGKSYMYAAEIRLEYGLEREPTTTEYFIAGSSPIDITTGLTSSMPGKALTDNKIQGAGQ